MWRADGFWIALAALVVAAVCAATGVSQRLEYALYDAATSTSAPAPLPEIAIVGKSNVGKSSLINAITGQLDLI